LSVSDDSNPAWTHGGGIVFRQQPGGTEILIVRASRAPHDWVMPKGHIDPGETASECARREIREEAGVDAEAVMFLGEDAYTTPDGKAVNAAFFLMRYLTDMPPEEERERRWCTFAEAMSLVQFAGVRTLIAAARARLS
jgi:8-oxo-dGTP pyrophosphatase MutT (NUDIX family)